MEEDEYKSTYNELTPVRCVFEKTLTNNQAKCRLSQHFCLADREGYSCESFEASSKCIEFLEKLREKSIFVLKVHDVDRLLPHNMEIRVQVGGVIGLEKLTNESFDGDNPSVVEDIRGVIEQSLKHFGSFEALPYSKIIQSVVQFQGRRRRKR